MPIGFAIDPTTRLVSYIVHGDPTPGEARAFLSTVLAHPEYQRGFHFLGDRRGADRPPSSAYSCAAGGALKDYSGFLAPCRWAVVVADDVSSGMIWLTASVAARSRVEIRPFRALDEATAWLGVTAPAS